MCNIKNKLNIVESVTLLFESCKMSKCKINTQINEQRHSHICCDALKLKIRNCVVGLKTPGTYARSAITAMAPVAYSLYGYWQTGYWFV